MFGREKTIELPVPLAERLRGKPFDARSSDELEWLGLFTADRGGDEVLSVGRVNGRLPGGRWVGYLAVTPTRFLLHGAVEPYTRDLGAYRSSSVEYSQIERCEFNGKAVCLSYFEFLPDLQFTTLEVWGVRAIDRPTVGSLPFHASLAQRERSSIDGGKWLEILSVLEPGDERILCERATVGDARGERPVDLFITAHRLMWVGDDGEVLGVLRRGLRLGRDHGTLGHFRVLLKARCRAGLSGELPAGRR